VLCWCYGVRCSVGGMLCWWHGVRCCVGGAVCGAVLCGAATIVCCGVSLMGWQNQRGCEKRGVVVLCGRCCVCWDQTRERAFSIRWRGTASPAPPNASSRPPAYGCILCTAPPQSPSSPPQHVPLSPPSCPHKDATWITTQLHQEGKGGVYCRPGKRTAHFPHSSIVFPNRKKNRHSVGAIACGETYQNELEMKAQDEDRFFQ
jgi:hypothetical protein